MLERRPVRFLVIAHTASAPGELAGRFGCREVETVRHLAHDRRRRPDAQGATFLQISSRRSISAKKELVRAATP